MAVIPDAEIVSRLHDHAGWAYTDGMLVKRFELPSFMEVVGLVNDVAAAAEAADHHPDMLINYRRITFTLVTHEAGGVTERDFALLALIDSAAQD